MKYFKNGLMALVGISVMAVAGAAMAKTKAGIKFDAGSVFKAGLLWETVVVSPGDTLMGIGIVDKILNSSSATTWADGDNGRELTFVFDGFLVERITLLGGGLIALVEFSGGTVDMFSDGAQNFTNGASGGGTAADIASASDGTSFLNMDGAGGGIVCDALCFSGAGGAITLTSTIFLAAAGDLSTVSSGSGSGFLDVDLGGAGVANGSFDSNGQPSGQDFLLTSSFGAPVGFSNFPLQGTVDLRGIAVPEPAAMAIFGLGLIALGGLARRRRRTA